MVPFGGPWVELAFASLGAVVSLITLFAAIAALTKTPTDDVWARRLLHGYYLVWRFALNVVVRGSRSEKEG
jgi:hypothetical protein